MSTTRLATSGLLMIAFGGTPLMAAQEETQLWLNSAASTSIDDATTATVDISQRFRENDDQFLARISLDRKVSDNLAIGAGYAWLSAGTSQEHRPHQQVVATFERVSLRLRLEERFLEGADRPALRMRTRLQYAQPIDSRTRASASVEWLYNAQQATRGIDPRTDQWRFIVGVDRNLSKRVKATASYGLFYAPRQNAADRVSHVPSLGLAIRL